MNRSQEVVRWVVTRSGWGFSGKRAGDPQCSLRPVDPSAERPTLRKPALALTVVVTQKRRSEGRVDYHTRLTILERHSQSS